LYDGRIPAGNLALDDFAAEDLNLLAMTVEEFA